MITLSTNYLKTQFNEDCTLFFIVAGNTCQTITSTTSVGQVDDWF